MSDGCLQKISCGAEVYSIFLSRETLAVKLLISEVRVLGLNLRHTLESLRSLYKLLCLITEHLYQTF